MENQIISNIEKIKSKYGIISVDSKGRYATKDNYDFYLYNKDIPIVGGQYINLTYSQFTHDGNMYLYELTVVDPISKQYESKIIASHRFKNLSMPQLENTFGKMINVGTAHGVKRKFLNLLWFDRMVGAMFLIFLLFIGIDIYVWVFM